MVLPTRIVCISLVAFLFSSRITAQPVATGNMNSQRIENIGKVLESFIKSNNLNGAVAVIHHNNQLVYNKAFGYADVEKKELMKTDAIFRIASQTKAITSSSIMILMEEGKLLLDDPIEKYLPSFKSPKVIKSFNFKDSSFTTVPANRSLTIRDLLTHTSGIGYAQIGSDTARALYAKFGIVGGIGVTNPATKLSDQISQLGTLPLMHQPGDRFTYGLNIDVLGRLVEVLSGMSLAEFFKKRIFDPLEMKDAYFFQPLQNWSRVVPLYSNSENGKLVKLNQQVDLLGGLYTDYPRYNGSYYSGGAGLSCTAGDYANFLQMLLNNGVYKGKRILSKTSIRLMTTNQIGSLDFVMAGQQPNNKLGLGFILYTQKGSAQSPLSEGSYAGGGAFYSIYWVDPKEKITAQLMVNMLPLLDIDLWENSR